MKPYDVFHFYFKLNLNETERELFRRLVDFKADGSERTYYCDTDTAFEQYEKEKKGDKT